MNIRGISPGHGTDVEYVDLNQINRNQPAPVQSGAEGVQEPKDENEFVLKVSDRSVLDAIDRAHRVNSGHSTRAEFSVHERTKDIMIKIVDAETNEVIREFPPKKFLDLLAKLWDLAGILVDERR